MARIVILEHELQRGLGLPYMVNTFAERWRGLGHEVVWHYGAQDPPPGDLAILHLDLTTIPDSYRGLVAHYPRTLNARVLTVAKSSFSRQLVRRDTAWSGPVIVKTDANFGGRPEHLLRQRAQRDGLPCDIAAGPVATEYPIYASARDVPEDFWQMPGIIVEKFLPERDAQGRYLVRVWTFLGDRERNLIWRGTHPIVKAENVIARDPAEVPEAMRAWREKLGFEFAKLDYVVRDEGVVLLDVNRTPAFPSMDIARRRDALFPLADGIEAYLR